MQFRISARQLLNQIAFVGVVLFSFTTSSAFAANFPKNNFTLSTILESHTIKPLSCQMPAEDFGKARARAEDHTRGVEALLQLISGSAPSAFAR